MSATIIEEFFVKVGLDAPLGPLKALSHAVEGIASRLVSMDVAFVAAAAGAVKFVQHVVDEAEGFRKLGVRIGATGVEVEQYVEALSLINIPHKQAEESLTALSITIGRAASGMQRTQKIFNDVGVAYQDSTGKIRPTLEVLDELRAKLGKMPRGEAEAFLERLGIGAEYAKTLMFDLHGLKEEVEKVDHALGVNSEKLAVNAKKAGAQYRGLTKEVNLWKLTLNAASKSSATNAIPALTRLFERLTEKLQTLRQIVTNIFAKLSAQGGSVLTPLINAFNFLSHTALTAVEYVLKFTEWMVTSETPAAKAAKYILGIATAMKILNLRFLQSPVFWFVALGLAIVAIVEDFNTFLQGGDSLFGKLPTWGKMVYGLIGGLLLVVPVVLAIEKAILAVAAAKAFWALTIMEKVIPAITDFAWSLTKALARTAIAAAANPLVLIIGAIVVAVAALSYGIYKLVQNWDTVKAKMLGIWNAIKEKASAFANAFTNFFTFEPLVRYLEWLVEKFLWFKDKVLGVWEGIKDKAKSFGALFKMDAPTFGAPVAANAGNTVLGGPMVAGATTNNRNVDVNQNVKIVVNGNDAPTIGKAVASSLNRTTNQAIQRNARGGVY